MKLPRQTERRARFDVAFSQMPRWETWTTQHKALPEFTEDEAVPLITTRHHAKLIPRRVRRDMARQRSKREYRSEYELPEPVNNRK